MKPRIRKDLFRPEGFLCKSKETRRGISGWVGATGDTPEAAYANWAKRVEEFREESAIAQQRFENLRDFDQWVPDSELRGISKPVAFWRRLLRSVKGEKT